MEFHINKDGVERTYPPIVGVTWATFNAFRNLGFTAEEIFVLEGNGGEVVVQLRTQGKKFNALVGALRPAHVAEFFAQWAQFQDDLRDIPEELLAKAYDAWLSWQGGATGFVAAIVMHGIVLPCSKSGVAFKQVNAPQARGIN